jgi:hypothetical protein
VRRQRRRVDRGNDGSPPSSVFPPAAIISSSRWRLNRPPRTRQPPLRQRSPTPPRKPHRPPSLRGVDSLVRVLDTAAVSAVAVAVATSIPLPLGPPRAPALAQASQPSAPPSPPHALAAVHVRPALRRLGIHAVARPVSRPRAHTLRHALPVSGPVSGPVPRTFDFAEPAVETTVASLLPLPVPGAIACPVGDSPVGRGPGTESGVVIAAAARDAHGGGTCPRPRPRLRSGW